MFKKIKITIKYYIAVFKFIFEPLYYSKKYDKYSIWRFKTHFKSLRYETKQFREESNEIVLDTIETLKDLDESFEQNLNLPISFYFTFFQRYNYVINNEKSKAGLSNDELKYHLVASIKKCARLNIAKYFYFMTVTDSIEELEECYKFMRHVYKVTNKFELIKQPHQHITFPIEKIHQVYNNRLSELKN